MRGAHYIPRVPSPRGPLAPEKQINIRAKSRFWLETYQVWNESRLLELTLYRRLAPFPEESGTL